MNTYSPCSRLWGAEVVTTAGSALDTAVMVSVGPFGIKPPSHEKTPSAPLTMTVNLSCARLAKLVQCQSSLVKPDSSSAPVSALQSVWLVAAASCLAL